MPQFLRVNLWITTVLDKVVEEVIEKVESGKKLPFHKVTVFVR